MVAQVEARDAVAEQVAVACGLPTDAGALGSLRNAAAALSELWPSTGAGVAPPAGLGAASVPRLLQGLDPGVEPPLRPPQVQTADLFSQMLAAVAAGPQVFPGFPAVMTGSAALQAVGLPLITPMAHGPLYMPGDQHLNPVLTGATTPEAAPDAAATPFGTFAAADVMAALQQPAAPEAPVVPGQLEAAQGGEGRRLLRRGRQGAEL